jgi:hypothetical protein
MVTARGKERPRGAGAAASSALVQGRGRAEEGVRGPASSCGTGERLPREECGAGARLVCYCRMTALVECNVDGIGMCSSKALE